MPRYKFSWDSLPSTLLRGLKRDFGLEGDVPVALRKSFGARPSEDFIQAAWPTLLNGWLKNDRPSRMAVVDQLRNRKLAEERLVALVTAALHVARKRRPTKPTNASRQERLRSKRLHSRKKGERRTSDDE